MPLRVWVDLPVPLKHGPFYICLDVSTYGRATHATVAVHHYFVKAPCLKSSIPHPKIDFSKNQSAIIDE